MTARTTGTTGPQCPHGRQDDGRARELCGNTSPLRPAPGTWPSQHPVIASLTWVVILPLAFAPPANHQHRRAAARSENPLVERQTAT
ncbi:hypothetical protein Lesp01_87600 [Lentzea sp. NBRC 102530]|nr:hypothetical protein Lesp01_87600 [Lentzea sp. NBRC 102530]